MQSPNGWSSRCRIPLRIPATRRALQMCSCSTAGRREINGQTTREHWPEGYVCGEGVIRQGYLGSRNPDNKRTGERTSRGKRIQMHLSKDETKMSLTSQRN